MCVPSLNRQPFVSHCSIRITPFQPFPSLESPVWMPQTYLSLAYSRRRKSIYPTIHPSSPAPSPSPQISLTDSCLRYLTFTLACLMYIDETEMIGRLASSHSSYMRACMLPSIPDMENAARSWLPREIRLIWYTGNSSKK